MTFWLYVLFSILLKCNFSHINFVHYLVAKVPIHFRIKLMTLGYTSHVDYWLPFIQIGVGIHDSSWRGSYGGGIFTYDGSHGCVNTPRSAVQKIYNNIESTYPVVVHW